MSHTPKTTKVMTNARLDPSHRWDVTIGIYLSHSRHEHGRSIPQEGDGRGDEYDFGYTIIVIVLSQRLVQYIVYSGKRGDLFASLILRVSYS